MGIVEIVIVVRVGGVAVIDVRKIRIEFIAAKQVGVVVIKRRDSKGSGD